MPSSRPRMGLLVMVDRIPCSLLPAVCSSAFPIRSMPYRNMAMPPIRVNTLKMVIRCYTSILCFVFTIPLSIIMYAHKAHHHGKVNVM